MSKEAAMKAEYTDRLPEQVSPVRQDVVRGGQPPVQFAEASPGEHAALVVARPRPPQDSVEDGPRADQKNTIWEIVRKQDRVHHIGSVESQVDQSVSAHLLPHIRRGETVIKIDLTGRKRTDPTTAKLDEEARPWFEQTVDPQLMFREHATPQRAAEILVDSMKVKDDAEAESLVAEARNLFSFLIDDEDPERPGDPTDNSRPGEDPSIGKLHDAIAFMTGLRTADKMGLRGPLEPALRMRQNPDDAKEIFMEALLERAARANSSLREDEIDTIRQEADIILNILTYDDDPQRPGDLNNAKRPPEKPSMEKIHDAVSLMYDTPTVDKQKMRDPRSAQTPITFTDFQLKALEVYKGSIAQEEDEDITHDRMTALARIQEFAATQVREGYKEDLTLTGLQQDALMKYKELEVNKSKGQLWNRLVTHTANLLAGQSGERSIRHNIEPNAKLDDYPEALRKLGIRPDATPQSQKLQRNLLMSHTIAQIIGGYSPRIIQVDGSELADPEQWSSLSDLCRSNGITLIDAIYTIDETVAKRLDGALVFSPVENNEQARLIAEKVAETPSQKTSESTSEGRTSTSREPSSSKLFTQDQIQYIDPDVTVIVMPDGHVYHRARRYTFAADLDDPMNLQLGRATLPIDRLMIQGTVVAERAGAATRALVRGGQTAARTGRAALERAPLALPGRTGRAVTGGGDVPQLPAGGTEDDPSAPGVPDASHLLWDPRRDGAAREQGGAPGSQASGEQAVPASGEVPVEAPVGRGSRRPRVARLIGDFVGARRRGEREDPVIKSERENILNDPDELLRLITSTQDHLQQSVIRPLHESISGARGTGNVTNEDTTRLRVYVRDHTSYNALRTYVDEWVDLRRKGEKRNFGEYMEAKAEILARQTANMGDTVIPEHEAVEMAKLAGACRVWGIGADIPHAIKNAVQRQAIANAEAAESVGSSIPDLVPDDEPGRLRYYAENIEPLAQLTLQEFTRQFTPQVRAQYVYFIEKQINAFIAAKTDANTRYPGTIQGVLGTGSVSLVQQIMAAQDHFYKGQEEVLTMNFRDFAKQYLDYKVSAAYNQNYRNF